MFAKRIIPCLDVKNGRVVKGTNFVGLKDAGDPVQIARFYNEQGADELCFLDISASHEGRGTIANIVEKVAKELFIPLTVGGGIRDIDDISRLLNAGCDKISLNSAAIKNPDLIAQAAKKFGTQCVVVAIDVKSMSERDADGAKKYSVFINGGRIDANLDAYEWAKKVADLGAGEILLTSMDTDGTKAGFDLEVTSKISQMLNIPVIASGGAGTMEHILKAFKSGADAALAASVFHYKQIQIRALKQYLKDNGIGVRL